MSDSPRPYESVEDCGCNDGRCRRKPNCKREQEPLEPLRPSRLLETDHLMSVSEANGKGVSWLASTASQGFPTVLMRNSVPVAAVVPMKVYYAFMATQATDPSDQNGQLDG